MPTENEIEVKIGANTGDVEPKFAAAAEAVKVSVEKMKLSMESLKASMESLKGAFIEITAILAGGALFKDAVSSTIAMTGEVTSLSKKLGISREEASTLNIALKHIGSSAEEYIGTTTKLNRMLRTNEQSLKDMGVVTRKANGDYADQKDLLDSAMAAMMRYKEGTDRNMAAMALFGRGADDAAKFMKLNTEVMGESKEMAEAFGLVMGQDMADAAKKMKMGIATLKTEGEALEVAIGKALMPTLIDLSNVLKENAVPIIGIVSAVIGVFTGAMEILGEVVSGVMSIIKDVFVSAGEIIGVFFGESISGAQFFKNVLAVIEVTALAFGLVINEVFQSIKYGIDVLVVAPLKMMANVAKAAFSLDWDGVKSAWTDGMKDIDDITTKATEKMVKTAEEAATKMNNALLGIKDEKKVPDKHTGGNDAYHGRDKKPPKAKDMSRAQLALDKAELEASFKILEDNLHRSQALYDDAYARNLITTEEYYDAKLKIENAGLDKDIEVKRAEIAATKKRMKEAKDQGTPEGDKEEIQIKTQLVGLTTSLTILEAKRSETEVNNQRQMIEAVRKRASAIEQINIGEREKESNAAVDNAEKDAQMQYSMGMMQHAQMIELQRGFEDERNDIAKQALLERRQLEIDGPNDPIAIANLNAQLEDQARQHAQKMLEISRSAIQEANAPLISVANTMESTLSGVFNGLMQKTMSLGNAMKQMFLGLGNAIVSEIAKVMAKKVAAFAMDKLLNGGQATSDTAAAAAAAMKAMAGIPVVGPELALEAGASMMTVGGAYAATAIAEQGYDIPAGVNPMTQLHQKEMVLPAKYADTIRDMADNGSGGGDTHVHINAVDSQSVRRLFETHGSSLLSALRKQGRNFAS